MAQIATVTFKMYCPLADVNVIRDYYRTISGNPDFSMQQKLEADCYQIASQYGPNCVCSVDNVVIAEA
jgi:hypothetical protein